MVIHYFCCRRSVFRTEGSFGLLVSKNLRPQPSTRHMKGRVPSALSEPQNVISFSTTSSKGGAKYTLTYHRSFTPRPRIHRSTAPTINWGQTARRTYVSIFTHVQGYWERERGIFGERGTFGELREGRLERGMLAERGISGERWGGVLGERSWDRLIGREGLGEDVESCCPENHFLKMILMAALNRLGALPMDFGPSTSPGRRTSSRTYCEICSPPPGEKTFRKEFTKNTLTVVIVL